MVEAMDVEITEDADAKIEITLRGNATTVIQALVQGLPREALEQLRDRFEVELTRRKTDGL